MTMNIHLCEQLSLPGYIFLARIPDESIKTIEGNGREIWLSECRRPQERRTKEVLAAR